ncbi:hypothetical protein ACFWAZ_05290 [Streptomyces collinus]
MLSTGSSSTGPDAARTAGGPVRRRAVVARQAVRRFDEGTLSAGH